MKKILVFVLFTVFSIGLIGCSTNQSSPSSEKAPDTTANRGDSNSTANAPGTTPPGDTEGKSDADK